MPPMAAGWSRTSRNSMSRNIAHPRSRFGLTASLLILFATLLALTSPAFATASDSAPHNPQDGHGLLIAKDDTPSRFPWFMDSFNGLLIDDAEDEAGKPRGLDIVSRAPGSGTPIGNNRFETGEISLGGEMQQYSFSPTSAGSNASDAQNNKVKRANTTVYLSLTICTGPILDESVSNKDQPLPQLSVYISTSGSQNLGPGSSGQTPCNSTGGHMNATVTTESDVYIGVAAPDGGDFTGSYSYQIAASTDDYFHNVNDTAGTMTLDGSGAETALLNTVNGVDGMLTEEQQKQWQNNTPVYTLFVNNANNIAASGLSRSYCALEHLSQNEKGIKVQTSMSHREILHNGLQEQFYVTGLNRSSTYIGVLALGNSTGSENGVVGGGGKVWKATNFTTKSDENCDVIYDLDFCSEVAYSVPSNPSMNMTDLRTKYDEYAANLYQNFNYSLQQIQCDTSNETIYSMAVGCDDCARAYKNWLCNVTIPRCEDYLSTSNTTILRNAGQSFPNGTEIADAKIRDSPFHSKPRSTGFIDKVIKSGPYREKLPKIETCHNLVRACPMSLGFSCPEGKYVNYSYDTSAALSDRALYSLESVTITSSIIAALLSFF
ncbi:stretch-activated Ca2+-permeable channel component-domain-containing protein [Aspergillus unguis]